MKVFAACAILGLILSLPGSAPAKNDKKDLKSSEKVERSTVVDPQVTVTLCVMSGSLTVRGWEKNELRASSNDADQIEFKRIDKTKDSTTPATRIDVMVLDGDTKHVKSDCQALADVEMDVPAGATVQVQTRDGDIRIVGVAAAYAGSQNGDIEIERVRKLVEAGSVGGSISLKDSSGRVNLNSAGGGVEVINLSPSGSDDALEVGTVSGDIQLDRVSNPKVVTKTVNGTVTMSGPLARSGSYGFTSMGGDLVLVMPSDASFKLVAKLNEKKDIVSEFPLKFLSEPAPSPPSPPNPTSSPNPKHAPEAVSPKGPKTMAPKGPVTAAPVVVVKPAVTVYLMGRFTAIHGTGDATISVASFGGTIHLKKM